MVRKITAVVAGILVVGLVVMVLQQISAAMHPIPEGLDPFDRDQADAFRDHMAAMPAGAWALAFTSELIGAFAGAFAAGKIARSGVRWISAIIVGVALLGSTANWMAFEHPTWFIAGQLIGYPLVLMGVWTLLGLGDSASSESKGVA